MVYVNPQYCFIQLFVLLPPLPITISMNSFKRSHTWCLKCIQHLWVLLKSSLCKCYFAMECIVSFLFSFSIMVYRDLSTFQCLQSSLFLPTAASYSTNSLYILQFKEFLKIQIWLCHSVASWPVYRLLRRQVRWSVIHIFLRIFQFVVTHTVRDFGIDNKAEVDIFLELSCFFDDPRDVGNFISGSSAFVFF